MRVYSKNLFFKFAFSLLFALLVLVSFLGFNTANSYATQTPVFELEAGAWVRCVDIDNLIAGGDTTCIRFSLKFNKAYIDQNNVTKVKAVAVIEGNTKQWVKEFTDFNFLNTNEEYTHYFDFANFPKQAYGKNVTLSVSAFSNNDLISGSNQTVTRTMEYVATMGLANGQEGLNEYIGGGSLLINQDENVFVYDSTPQITVDGYDGSEIKTVYIDGVKQADSSFVSGATNTLTVDLAKLVKGVNHSLVAITINGNAIVINSIFTVDKKFDINSARAFDHWLAWVRKSAWNSIDRVSDRYFYAQLTANIDMSDSQLSSAENENCCASGVFDGNGFTISNLNLTNDSGGGEDYLFGYTQNLVIKNVGFINLSTEKSCFFNKNSGDATTDLINCYFELNSKDYTIMPFPNGGIFNRIENVIFKTSISLRNEQASIFKLNNPNQIVNTFVIGQNVRTGTLIQVIDSTKPANIQNCGSYLSENDLGIAISNGEVSVQQFSPNFWNLQAGYPVWLNK